MNAQNKNEMHDVIVALYGEPLEPAYQTKVNTNSRIPYKDTFTFPLRKKEDPLFNGYKSAFSSQLSY